MLLFPFVLQQPLSPFFTFHSETTKMLPTTKLRIQPFVQHYEAYLLWKQFEEQLDCLAKFFHPDNCAYLINNPFQEAYEANLKEAEPELWDWYTWWLYEANEGQQSMEFQLDDEPPQNVQDFPDLGSFLEAVIYEV